jgi:hypothetical protein
MPPSPSWHDFYLTAVSWAYVFWNTVRILTYLPTVRMLLQPDASARHHSLASWGSWVLSNLTLALYLFEQSGHAFNALVLLNSGNALMCCITCALIVRLRRREQGASRTAHRPAPWRGASHYQPANPSAQPPGP